MLIRSEIGGNRGTKGARVTDFVIEKPKAARDVDFVGRVERIGHVAYPQVNAQAIIPVLPANPRVRDAKADRIFSMRIPRASPMTSSALRCRVGLVRSIRTRSVASSFAAPCTS
jgi:hypothetical protein